MPTLGSFTTVVAEAGVADVNEKTKGFTALPEKTTEKDVIDELEVAARVIRKRFGPDK